jgi:WD40 repeat protein
MLGSVQSLTFDDLRGLIQEARRQGFYIGPDQVIAMSQVVMQLTRDPDRAFHPDHLKTALGSIICKSPNEQAAFYQIFERWYRLHMAESLRVAGQRRAARALTETDLPVSRPLPFIAVAATVIAAVFFGSVYYYLSVPDPDADTSIQVAEETQQQDGQDDGSGQQQEDATQDGGDQVGEDGEDDKTDKDDKTDEGGSAPDGGKELPTDSSDKTDEGVGEPGTDQGGGDTAADQGGEASTDQGGGEASTDQGGGEESTDQGAGSGEQGGGGGEQGEDGTRTRPDIPQLAAPTVVAAEAPPEAGWWDAYSIYFLALRNAAAATPLVAFLAWLAWRWTSRQAWMERRAERDPPELTTLRIARPKNSLFGSRNYTRALQQLRRHHRRPTRNLDVERTMLGTVKRVGLFAPVYESRQTSPEYLVLADRSTLSDHQAHLIRELVLQSKTEQLYIDLYYFDGDPRVCYTEKGRLDTVPLEELAARHAAQRLLIAADGAALFDPVRGAPRAWTQMFSAWRERALIVPQTADRWGAQQAALHGAGFGIIPLDESGLMSLAEAFEESGAASGEFTPPYLRPPVPPGAEYPDLLVDADDMWLDPDAPVSEATLETLKGELRNYLGARGCELLFACATFPQPHWDVTLYLDQVLHGDDDAGGREKRLVTLAQLPWFRRGQMPDYLRLLFLRELPAAREREVKVALQELLHSALEAPPGSSEIEVAHGTQRGLKRVISDFFQFGRPQAHDSLHDHIFVRFVLGGRPGPLDLELPRILQKILPWKGWDSFTTRAATRGVAGIACAVAIFAAFTMFEGPMRGVRVVEAGNSTQLADDITFLAAGSEEDAARLQWLEFSPTENRFIAVDTSGTMLLGVADDGGIRASRIAGITVSAAQFVAGGREVLVRDTAGTTALYSVKDLEAGYVELPRPVEPAERHVLSPARTHLIMTSGADVRYMRFGQFQKAQAAFTHPEPVEQVAMDPEATTISAVSRNYVSVFNLANGMHTKWAFGPGHHDLVGTAGVTRLWQVNQSRIVAFYDNGHVMKLENQSATLVTYPGSGMTAAAHIHTTEALWGLEGRLYPLQFGGGAHTLVAWGPEATEQPTSPMRAYHGHGGAVTGAFVDRTGRHAITLSTDLTVRVWDLEARDEVAVMRGMGSALALAALSPDNQRLLTVSVAGDLQLWNLDGVLAPTDVPPVPSDEPISIAVAGPSDGEAGAETEARQIAIQALVDAINEQEGVIERRVLVIRSDDGCDPAQALSEAETLVERSVSFIIGHPCPGVSQAVSQRYEQAGIIHISLAPRPADTSAVGATTFFLGPNFGDREGEIAGTMLAQNFGASRIAILHDGTAQRRGLARQVKFALNQHGVREAVFDWFAPETDEAAMVARLQQERIEVVYLAASHSVAGLIVRIAQSRDFHPQLVASSALTGSSFGDIAGNEGDGTLFLAPDPDWTPDARAAQQIESHRLHMALLAWADAVTGAGSITPDAVAAALTERLGSNYAWSGNFPPFTFSDTPTLPYVWHVWEGGAHHEHVTRSMALLIGVGTYEHYDPLDTVDADIAAMQSLVREQFELADRDVITLRDEGARHRDVVAAMRRLAAFTGHGDRVTIYVAARGGQVRDTSGEERDGMDETILLFDAANDGTGLNFLTDDAFDVMLDRLAGRDVTAILETDHRVRIADDGRDGRVRRAEAPFVETEPMRRIWSAAAPLQGARAEADASVFTRLFVQGAGAERRADFNRDGTVTNAEQADYVRSGAFHWCAERRTCRDEGFTPWLEAQADDFARALVPPDAETPATTTTADERLPRHENTYGVIVGIDVYANLDDIQGAVADARDIHSALLEAGVPAANLALITDSAATRPAILDALAQMRSRARPGDTVLFTYAGHGLQLDEATAGTETDGKDEAIALTGYLGATEDVIRDNDVRQLFSGMTDVQVIMLADTEWAGDLTDAGEPGNTPLANNMVYMSAVEDGTSMSVYTVDGEPRGALSWAFADAVRGSADLDRNLLIDTRELESFVRDQVLVLSEDAQRIVFAPAGRSHQNVLAVRDDAVAVPVLARPLRLFVIGDSTADALRARLQNVTASTIQQADLILDMKSSQILFGRDVVAHVDPVMAPSQIQPIINRWLLVRDLERLAEAPQIRMALRREQDSYDRSARIDLRFESPGHRQVTLVHVDARGLVRLLGDDAGAERASFEFDDPAGAEAQVSVRLPATAPDGFGHIIALVSDVALAPFGELRVDANGSVRAGELLALLHSAAPAAYGFASVPLRIEPLINPPAGKKLSEAESVSEGLVFQFGHGNQVNTTLFTPDGRYAISGGADGLINVWDVARKLLVKSVQSDLGPVNALAMTPDGRYLLGGGTLGSVRVWRFDTMRVAYDFIGLEQSVNAIAVSADGRRVAAAGGGKIAMIWNFETGEVVQRLSGHEDWIRAVGFSPDGRLLVTGSDDKTAVLWDVDTGRRVRAFDGHENWVLSAEFSPDGTRLVTSSSDQTMRLWDVETGAEIERFADFADWVRVARFSPDGTKLMSADDVTTIKIRDLESGEVETELQGHSGWIFSAGYSADGTMIVSGAVDQSVRLWDVASGEPVHTFGGLAGAVTATAFTPDARTVLTAASDGSLKVWNVSNGALVRLIPGSGQPVVAMTAMPDGTSVLIDVADTIRMVDFTSGAAVREFNGHKGQILAIAVSADGSRIASGSSDQMVRLWDTATGDLVATLDRHQDWVRDIAFSPDGRFVFSGSDDKSIVQWSVESGEAVHEFTGHTDWIRALAVSPDGDFLVSGSHDGTLIVWEVASGTALRTIADTGTSSLGLFYQHDGLTVVSGDGTTLGKWNVASGERVSSYDSGIVTLTDVALSRDGVMLATASSQGVALWRADAPTPLGTLMAIGESDYLIRFPNGQWTGSPAAIRDHVIWFEGYHPLTTPASEHPSYFGDADTVDFFSEPSE